jgi:hypothetical protein
MQQMFKFVYYPKYFQCPLTYCFHILHFSLPTWPQPINKSRQLYQAFCNNYGPFTILNIHIIDKSMLKLAYHLKYFQRPLTYCFHILQTYLPTWPQSIKKSRQLYQAFCKNNGPFSIIICILLKIQPNNIFDKF